MGKLFGAALSVMALPGFFVWYFIEEVWTSVIKRFRRKHD